MIDKVNNEIAEKGKRAYDIAYNHDRDYGHCPHSTIRALLEVYDGKVNTDVFRSLGVFAGGGALEGDGSCGAYIASLYFLASRFGIDFDEIGEINTKPGDNVSEAGTFRHGGDKILYPLAKKMHERFIDRYGSIICSQIHRKIYGRPFYDADPQEHDKLKNLLENNPDIYGCWAVCGNAARWTVEVYEEYLRENK